MAAAAASETKKKYSFEEVAKHHVTDDLWLIIAGKVYDVTPFMDVHPGGPEVLLAVTGKDATNDFEDIGHSKSAKEMMAKYCIGDIDSSTVPAKKAMVVPQPAPSRPDTSASFSITVLQFIVPVLMLGLAIALRIFAKSE